GLARASHVLAVLLLDDGDDDAAERLWEEACVRGYAMSCAALGRRAEEDKDLERAARFFDRGCALGLAPSCVFLAAGAAKRGRSDEALRLMARACDLGQDKACADLGELLIKAVRMKEARMWRSFVVAAVERACARWPTGLSCIILGGLRTQDGNPAEQKRIYQASCRAGGAQACAVLGEYEIREGDFPNGTRPYLRACDLGERFACRRMAKVSGAAEEQRRLYRRGCKLEDAESCYALSKLEYQTGRREAASALLEAPCAKGAAKACAGLAWISLVA